MINIQDKINDAKKKLAEKYNYSNPNQVPKIEKVVLHRGLGEALTNSAVLENIRVILCNLRSKTDLY